MLVSKCLKQSGKQPLSTMSTSTLYPEQKSRQLPVAYGQIASGGALQPSTSSNLNARKVIGEQVHNAAFHSFLSTHEKRIVGGS
jgi:hypothetical protein